MDKKEIIIKAESLKEAKEKVKTQIPKGFFLLSEKVIDEGRLKTTTAIEISTEIAFKKALSSIPKDAIVIEKNELNGSEIKILDIKAFDEQTAQTIAISEANMLRKNAVKVIDIKLSTIGAKGFWGIGKKPNKYKIEVLLQSIVEIKYRTQVQISIEIVEQSTLLKNLKKPELRQEALRILESNNWKPKKDEDGIYYYIAQGDYQRCTLMGKEAIQPLIIELQRLDIELYGIISVDMLSRGVLQKTSMLSTIKLLEVNYQQLRNALSKFTDDLSCQALKENSKVLELYEEHDIPTYTVYKIAENLISVLNKSRETGVLITSSDLIRSHEKAEQVKKIGMELFVEGGLDLMKEVFNQVKKNDFLSIDKLDYDWSRINKNGENPTGWVEKKSGGL